MPDDGLPPDRWHFDKRLNVATLLAVAGLTVGLFTTYGAGVSWSTKLDARLTSVEEWVKGTDAELAARREARRIADLELAERLAKLEANQQALVANQDTMIQLMREVQQTLRTLRTWPGTPDR